MDFLKFQFFVGGELCDCMFCCCIVHILVVKGRTLWRFRFVDHFIPLQDADYGSEYRIGSSMIELFDWKNTKKPQADVSVTRLLPYRARV